jgi:hypothetical protein
LSTFAATGEFGGGMTFLWTETGRDNCAIPEGKFSPMLPVWIAVLSAAPKLDKNPDYLPMSPDYLHRAYFDCLSRLIQTKL